MMMQGDSIPERMVISLTGMRSLDKSKLMMLEMLANANWERPIYVALTVGQENYMNLGDNFVQEGLVNRITPFTTNIDGEPVEGMKTFDTEKTYDNVMNRFKFGNVKQPGHLSRRDRHAHVLHPSPADGEAGPAIYAGTSA